MSKSSGSQLANRNAEPTTAMVQSRLPYPAIVFKAFGIEQGSWKALVEAVFPNATSAESVILALSYCRARKLDPFKKNVHIVPIWNKDLKRMVDTIWPGIGELRTTAFRTGEYAGRDDTEFGPDLTKKIGKAEVTFPEWAKVTVHRIVRGNRVSFAGPRVYWEETYATRGRDDDSPNDMWYNRPRGQLDKCAEAAALRAAFPEEVGSDYIPEEVQRGTPKFIPSVDSGDQPVTRSQATKESACAAIIDAFANKFEVTPEQLEKVDGVLKPVEDWKEPEFDRLRRVFADMQESSAPDITAFYPKAPENAQEPAQGDEPTQGESEATDDASDDVKAVRAKIWKLVQAAKSPSKAEKLLREKGIEGADGIDQCDDLDVLTAAHLALKGL